MCFSLKGVFYEFNQNSNRKNIFTFTHMKILLIFLLVNLFSFTAFSHATEEQRPRTDANVFGHVIDSATGEHIPFINVLVEDTRIGTITDGSGHYMLTNLPEGRHTLLVQGMGYETAHKEFTAVEGRTIEVDMEVVPTHIDLSEIVITASPTASGFSYQPNQAYIGEELQRRSEATFGEMLRSEPGVNMRSFGSMPSRPVIRGLDGDRILVLENGERMGDISETSADHSISLDPLAASRVEVVRGPATLLYGSSALGGVINLMTTDIPDDVETGSSGVFSLQGASVNNMGGGFGRYTYGFDSWATTARFSYRKAGDIQTPEGKLPNTSLENIDGALGFGFDRPNAAGGISLSMANQTFEIPESIDDPDETVEIRMQRQSLQGRLNHQRNAFFDKTQVRFNASRMFQQEVEIELEDGIWEEDVELEYEKYTFSSTITAQHKPRGIFDRGAVGLSLYAHSLDVGGDEAYTPGEGRVTMGVFTFQEIPLTNQLRFQAGLRLDFQHTTSLTNELFPDIDEQRNAFNYSGSFGLNYRPLEQLEIGGQFARSHRNPIIEELYAFGPHIGAGVFEIGDPDLKDEIGHGGDLFFRYKAGNLELEIAGFVNHFQNFIIFQPTGDVDEDSGYPIFRYEGDEARLMGGEVTLGLKPLDALSLNLGIDYVHGKRIGNGEEYLPFIPPFRFMADVEYDFGDAWVGGKLHTAAKQDRVAPEEDMTDGHTLVGLQAGYRLTTAGRHVIILRVDNLLDTRYRDHLSRIEDRNFPMPGRNFNLAYRWYF